MTPWAPRARIFPLAMIGLVTLTGSKITWEMDPRMPVWELCLWSCLWGYLWPLDMPSGDIFFIIVTGIRRSNVVVGRAIPWVGDSEPCKMEKVSQAQTTKHSSLCFLQTADTTRPAIPIPAAWLPTTVDCTFSCFCQGILSQWQGHQLRHHWHLATLCPS